MTPVKPWYASITIWGAVVAGAAIVLNAWGVPVSDDEQRQAAELLTHAGELVGLILVVWGRVRARHRLSAGPSGDGTPGGVGRDIDGALLVILVFSVLSTSACSTSDGRANLLAACESWAATLKSAAVLRRAGQLPADVVTAIDQWRPALGGVCDGPPPTEAGATLAFEIVERGLGALADVHVIIPSEE